jgi:hypothetical protein
MTELKMVMGEFPFDDPWKETFLERVWYVCYAVLIFFLAVNIFLAIIVEAFVLVKRRLADEVLVERSMLVDFIGLMRYRLLGRSLNWPARLAVARHLHTTRHFRDAVTSKELKQSKFLEFKTRLEAQNYLDFYYGLLGEDILAKTGRDFLRLKQRQRETHKCLIVLFSVPEEQMDKSAKVIQAAWQEFRRCKQEKSNPNSASRSKLQANRAAALRKRKSLSVSFHAENVSSSSEESRNKSGRGLPTLLSNGVGMQPRNSEDPTPQAQGLLRLFSR